MPSRPGTGKLQQRILAQLDGVPVDFADLVAAVAGPEPTQSQYTAIHYAVHSLARGRFVELSRAPAHAPGASYRLRVLKADPQPVHVRATDRASGIDDEAPPVTPAERYAELTGRAWQAFGTDPGYGAEIARAAVELLAAEGIAPGALVSDDDVGAGEDPGPAQVHLL
jgi:hypothetical protein